MKYYYKSKKGHKVLCLEHPISEDSRYKHSAHLFEPATQGEYENYLAAKNAKIEISALKHELAKTDYIAIKIAESDDESEIAQLRSTYAAEITRRREIRVRINQLEELL